MTPALLNDLSVQIERRTEPYSGLPLVAVSGTFSGECPQPMHVQVRYDGVPRSRAEVRRVTDGQPGPANPAADAAGPAQFAFGTHLPLEVNIGTISVVLVSDAGETILGEVSRSLLEAQGATSTRPRRVHQPHRASLAEPDQRADLLAASVAGAAGSLG